MNRSQFLTTSFCLLILFLFLKIYQHNKMVTVLYKKQRITYAKEKLIKKRNNLLVTLYQLQDQQVVRRRAREELGMLPLKPSQIVVLSSVDYPQVDLIDPQVDLIHPQVGLMHTTSDTMRDHKS